MVAIRVGTAAKAGPKGGGTALAALFERAVEGGAAGVGLGGMPRAGVLRDGRGGWHRGDLFG